MKGDRIRDEKAVWRLVVRFVRETELGKLCRKAGGDLEQIQLLGHASVKTTERYLGTEQQLVAPVNDGLGLDLG